MYYYLTSFQTVDKRNFVNSLNDLYNKIVDLINLKKIDNKTIDELNRDLIISYIDKIIVYEEEKVDIILKYERELIK